MGDIRIASGSLKGRPVETPEGCETRPLLSRLRKSLADVLRPKLPGARILDLFAGSGAIAFELLSNGAAEAVAVERDLATAELVRRNARGLGLTVEVIEGDALAVVPQLARRGDAFDVILVAPPYRLGLQQRTLRALEECAVLANDGLVVVQREKAETQPEPGGKLCLVRERAYGRTVFEFYAASGAPKSAEIAPTWAWWNLPEPQLPLRYAPHLLGRASAFEKLIYRGGPPLDRELDRYQRGNPSMGSTDRRIVTSAVYGLARNRELYRRVLPDDTPGSGRYLMLALLDRQCQHRLAGKLPLPVGGRSWRADLERLETLRLSWVQLIESAWRQPVADSSTETLEAMTNLFAVPAWWLRYGPWCSIGDAVLELARLKTPQDPILRVQTHRADRDQVLKALADLGIPATQTPRSPWGLRIRGRHNLRATTLYREGRVEVQDEGSQLVAWFCDPKPGERLLDFCAGAGGKALALAAVTGGEATVVAHDAESARLEAVQSRARRAQLRNIRVVRDATELQRFGPYDLVLVDVPCTSSGTLRRNPDVAWRWAEHDLQRFSRLQAEILDEAARLVRPGGRLVYATCSVFQAENSAQTHAFHTRHPEFFSDPPGDSGGASPLNGVPGVGSGTFRLAANLPDYDGDAFFLARFRRTG